MVANPPPPRLRVYLIVYLVESVASTLWVKRSGLRLSDVVEELALGQAWHKFLMDRWMDR